MAALVMMPCAGDREELFDVQQAQDKPQPFFD